MTALISKPGITSASTLAIPKDWDKTWFRNFIQNQLKGADVRNAIGLNGIVITGNISSPYATISLGAPFTVAGTTVTIAGGLVIGAPTGGSQGTGTINVASGLFLNGARFPEPITIVRKASNTSRTTTIVPANDPELVFAVPVAGTYAFSFICGIHQGAVGAVGMNIGVNYSGTLGNSQAMSFLQGSATTSGEFVTTVNTTVAAVTNSIGQTNTFTGSLARASGYFVATTTGTFALSWSQNTSSATATVMELGGVLLIQRIA